MADSGEFLEITCHAARRAIPLQSKFVELDSRSQLFAVRAISNKMGAMKNPVLVETIRGGNSVNRDPEDTNYKPHVGYMSHYSWNAGG